MCLAVPGRVVSRSDDAGGAPSAAVELNGVLREGVSLALLPEVQIGDYVVVHLGMALDRVEEKTALEMLADLDRLRP
jgi:hydrogenase expression/formation protein HypC